MTLPEFLLGYFVILPIGGLFTVYSVRALFAGHVHRAWLFPAVLICAIFGFSPSAQAAKTDRLISRTQKPVQFYLVLALYSAIGAVCLIAPFVYLKGT